MRPFAGVEDFDEHAVHVVGLDAVPEQRDENAVVAEDVGDATAETRVGEPFGDVQYDQEDHQRDAKIQQDPRHSAATRFTAGQQHTHTATTALRALYDVHKRRQDLTASYKIS